MDRIYERGDIVYVDLGERVGSRQGGVRPAVVIQNDKGNKNSPTLIVAPLTSKWCRRYPVHVFLNKNKYGLDNHSVVLCEQIVTIDKTYVDNVISKLDEKDMYNVGRALQISVGLV